MNNPLKTGLGPISTNSSIPRLNARFTQSFQSTGDESCFPALSKISFLDVIWKSKIVAKLYERTVQIRNNGEKRIFHSQCSHILIQFF